MTLYNGDIYIIIFFQIDDKTIKIRKPLIAVKDASLVLQASPEQQYVHIQFEYGRSSFRSQSVKLTFRCISQDFSFVQLFMMDNFVLTSEQQTIVWQTSKSSSQSNKFFLALHNSFVCSFSQIQHFKEQAVSIFTAHLHRTHLFRYLYNRGINWRKKRKNVKMRIKKCFILFFSLYSFKRDLICLS